MGSPAPRIATYQDVLDAPEGHTAELMDGSLWVAPRPGVPHQSVSSEMGADLVIRQRRKRGDGPHGWIILKEVELHLGDPTPKSLVIVPDLSGWRRERMPRRPTTPAISLRPDWVCEILSPGPHNVRRDRLVKLPLYHQLGVPWVWIADPLGRTIEVYRHQAEGYLLQIYGGDGEVTLPPFDEAPFVLGNWWPEVDEDETESLG